MASTITAATMTVTITESISLNGADQGATNTLSIASINEVVKRIVTISPLESGLIGFSASSSTDMSKSYLAGQFDEDDVRYIRITNLDDTNFVTLVFRSSGNAEVAIKLDAGHSFIFPGDNSGGVLAVMDASASALTVSLEDLQDVTADADTSSCDVEVFVASA
jgi:hypothetical protein